MTHPFDKIVIASGNPGKLREFNALLANCGMLAVSQREYAVPEAAETGLTFVENAIIKARNAAAHTGLPSLADDSGIEVDALNGAPGIYSARFAGVGASDEQNNRKLLEALRDVPADKRRARYQCVIVLMRNADDPMPVICEGTWEGSITDHAVGDGGFGYDPLFWLPDRHCTSAQLDTNEKNRVSHRAQAMNLLVQRLLMLSRRG